MSTTDPQILKRLIQSREQAGLSQSQAARLLGTDKATIAAIESNCRPLTQETFAALCCIYDVSETWALSGCNPNFDRQSVMDKARSGGMSFSDASKLADLLESLRQEGEVKS